MPPPEGRRSFEAPTAPGPPDRAPGTWLLGSARALVRDQIGMFAAALARGDGDVVRFRVGPPRIGFVADVVFRPGDARQILATDAARYDKEAPGFADFRRIVGHGLLTSDGDRWRRDRRIVAPLFARRRLVDYVDTMVAASERLVASWEGAARTGAEVDLTEGGLGYALDVLGHAVFGEDMSSAAAVLRATVPAMNEHVTRRALSPVRLPAWWPTPTSRRARQARRSLQQLVDDLIARRRSGSLDGRDLLSLLLSARDPEDGSALDDAAVRDQALIFLLAGHETAGSALAFSLHLLGRHPVVQERVRSEVAEVAGTGPISADALERLEHTAHVVNEALRLYPPAHILVRRATEPASLCGRAIEPGQFLAVSIWGIHHNPSAWPDPERFDPDRFATSPAAGDGPGEGQARYRHLPFGGGPRACIGQHLAFAELVVAVATIVRSYRLDAGHDPPVLEAALTLKPAGPLPCRPLPISEDQRPR